MAATAARTKKKREMSSSVIDAISVEQEKKKEPESVPCLILACFVFRSGKSVLVDWADEKMQVWSVGNDADFKNFLEKEKTKEEYKEYGDNIKVKIYSPDETSTNSARLCANSLKNYAEQLAGNSSVKKPVDIKIFVPESSGSSLNTEFIKYLFGAFDGDEEARKWWKALLGDPIEIDSEKIKVSCMESSFGGIGSSEPEGKAASSPQQPTTKDAQVAAVLCEYTYLLVRRHDYTKKNTKANKKRQGDTSDEILNLAIIPSRWKEKCIVGGGTDLAEATRKDIHAQGIIKGLGLEDWDAIDFNGNGWYGMREHRPAEWESSLSKKIKDGLQKKKGMGSFAAHGSIWSAGFGSVLFVNETTRTVMYCAAGSDFGSDLLWNGDWTTTNISQFFVGISPQYTHSVTNAKVLNKVIDSINAQRKPKEEPVRLFFIGHSLGGGLASNNALITSDKHAITFNAAGLNWLRVPVTLAVNNPGQLLHPIARRERVHLFVIKGEILDVVQSTVTPTPWFLRALTLNIPLPGQAKAYSSSKTRKEIQAPADKDGKLPNSLQRHSMVNFLSPAIRIKNINI